MEKRVLLAVTLSFVVLVIYQTLFVRPVPRRPPGSPPAAASGPTGGATVSQADQTPGNSAAVGAPAVPAPATPATAEPAAATVVGDAEAREIVVESESIRAVFSSRGAELKSWQLKGYTEQKQPIDILPAGLPPSDAGAFALVAEDRALTERLRSALFRPSATRLDIGTGEARLVFDYQDSSGLSARKTYEFGHAGQPFVVNFSAAVQQNGTDVPVALTLGPGLGDTARATGSTSFLSPSYYQLPEGIMQRGRDVTRLPAAKLAASPVHGGAFTAVGVDDHYFMGVLLPGDRQTQVTYEPLTLPTSAGPRELVRFRAKVDGGLENVPVFLGPKQYEVLAATDRELVRTINFGMFDWLVVPLLRALNWINQFVGNFGWSIILLTLLINGAIAPLRHRSVVSMRKMQELQPQVKAIQDRYANLKATDPARQKMNTEMMNLYREKGVNPASGCVPLLLTMPVLFAFYSMLSQAIELRGAPFIGWIQDLSQHDPFYVTPLLMGATMFWQQKMTPSTADPVQQRVMMFMPLMFTFMFLWAPSGLVLYWLMSNLWAIGQQYATNYLIGPAKVPSPRQKTS